MAKRRPVPSLKSSCPKFFVLRNTPWRNLPDWLSSRNVRTYLGISRDAFFARLKSGELPHRRFGRLIRVPKEAVRP